MNILTRTDPRINELLQLAQEEGRPLALATETICALEDALLVNAGGLWVACTIGGDEETLLFSVWPAEQVGNEGAFDGGEKGHETDAGFPVHAQEMLGGAIVGGGEPGAFAKPDAAKKERVDDKSVTGVNPSGAGDAVEQLQVLCQLGAARLLGRDGWGLHALHGAGGDVATFNEPSEKAAQRAVVAGDGGGLVASAASGDRGTAVGEVLFDDLTLEPVAIVESGRFEPAQETADFGVIPIDGALATVERSKGLEIEIEQNVDRHDRASRLVSCQGRGYEALPGSTDEPRLRGDSCPGRACHPSV